MCFDDECFTREPHAAPDRSSRWSLAEDDISHFVLLAATLLLYFRNPKSRALLTRSHHKSPSRVDDIPSSLPPRLIAASAISGRFFDFSKEAQSQAKHQRCSFAELRFGAWLRQG